jgi:XTP/dITP diphosphohydrolase
VKLGDYKGKLIIATHNQGKLREMRSLLAPYGLDCISAGDLGLAEPEETGTTFEENALIKAQAAAMAANLPALADDSGLCVDALDGRPGVYTADWAERQSYEGGPGRDWYMAMGKVEGMLCALGADVDRSCSFNSTLALAWPSGEYAVYRGSVNGTLVWPPRGQKGFGYDPVFAPEGSAKTFGEIEWDQKQLIDHRADAFKKLISAEFEA